MKKLFTIAALVMTAVFTWAQSPVYKTGTIRLAAGITNYAVAVSLCDDGESNYRYLDCFKFKNTTGAGTGTVVVSSADIGITTTVYNAGSHIPKYSTVSYPRREQAEYVTAGYVSTNFPVQYVNAGYSITTGGVSVTQSTVTNYYMSSAVGLQTMTQTKYERYACRVIVITVTQPSSPTDTVYTYSLFAF